MSVDDTPELSPVDLILTTASLHILHDVDDDEYPDPFGYMTNTSSTAEPKYKGWSLKCRIRKEGRHNLDPGYDVTLRRRKDTFTSGYKIPIYSVNEVPVHVTWKTVKSAMNSIKCRFMEDSIVSFPASANGTATDFHNTFNKMLLR